MCWVVTKPSQQKLMQLLKHKQNKEVQSHVKWLQNNDIELFWSCTKLPLNWRKPEHSSSLRSKNTKEVLIMNKKLTIKEQGLLRTEKSTRLQTPAWKIFAKPFKMEDGNCNLWFMRISCFAAGRSKNLWWNLLCIQK